MHVPGDWNFQKAELQNYEGVIWYQTRFTYHPAADHLTFLYLGAANYIAKIWINGEPLCQHEGGFTSFNHDATQLLRDGENVVIISVDSTFPILVRRIRKNLFRERNDFINTLGMFQRFTQFGKDTGKERSGW